MNKGKEKKEENYIKKGGKFLKNASFWASPRPPQTYLSGEKNELISKEGGNYQNARYISMPLFVAFTILHPKYSHFYHH